MKRILVIILCLISLTSFVLADEKEDSLWYYDQIIVSAQETGNIEAEFEGYRQLLRLYKEIEGDVSQDTVYAVLETGYASLYYQIGDYNSSISLLVNASQIFESVLGYYHSINASLLANIASCYSGLCDYQKAIEVGIQALEICRVVKGEDHLDYASLLGKIAGYYTSLNDNTKAIELLILASEIQKNKLGDEHPDYATSLSNLAILYSNNGDYTKAIELGTQALEIRKNTLGGKHPSYASSLNNLAFIYSNIGNYYKAIELGTQALEIRKSILGDKHPSYANSLSNLAGYYAEINDFPKAIEFGTQAMEIQKMQLSDEHPNYANSLANLAGYYAHLGNYIKAIEFGEQAMIIQKMQLSDEHPNYANSLANLAGYYAELDNFEMAIELGMQAMTIRKKTLGEHHKGYANSLADLSYYFLCIGDYKNAANLFRQLLSSAQSFLISNLSGLSFQNRKMFWEQYYHLFQFYPYFIVSNDDITGDVYDKTCLFSKGMLLSTDIEMSKLIMESEDSTILKKYQHLQSIRVSLNELYEKPIYERKINTDSLEQISDNLELELVRDVKVYGDIMRNLKHSWYDVKTKLNENDIAIEFISFPLLFCDTTIYAALTLRKNYDSPHMVMLFDDTEFNEITNTSYYDNPELSQLLWGSMAEELEGVQNIYFSPSGELYNIAIESLPHWSESCMMGDLYNLYRLSSTRELAIERSGTPSNGAVVYGGIKYDSDVSQMGMPRKDESFLAHRGFNPDSVTVRGNWDYLTWSLDEANEVDSILEIKNVDVKKVTGLDATETSFKDLSGQRKRIIHIATHGFYYNDSTAHRYNERERLGFLQLDNDRPRYVEDKAMTRSGLLFVGAQNTFNGVIIPDGVDDGVLTAQEVAQLDLRGLDLLVLSACQTGLGEITGDGVFGLQRGFKKAGAKSILMSLWNVNDNATHLLMTEFYRGWTSGMTIYAALRQAQSVVKEKYPDPKYWAAFILLDALD